MNCKLWFESYSNSINTLVFNGTLAYLILAGWDDHYKNALKTNRTGGTSGGGYKFGRTQSYFMQATTTDIFQCEVHLI